MSTRHKIMNITLALHAERNLYKQACDNGQADSATIILKRVEMLQDELTELLKVGNNESK